MYIEPKAVGLREEYIRVLDQLIQQRNWATEQGLFVLARAYSAAHRAMTMELDLVNHIKAAYAE